MRDMDWDMCQGALQEMIKASQEENGGFEANKSLPIINGTAHFLERGIVGEFEDVVTAALPPNLLPAGEFRQP